jgi:hypothetical protein
MIRRSQMSYIVDVCSSSSMSCPLRLRETAQSHTASASGTTGSQVPCAHCTFSRIWRASSALAQIARTKTTKRTRSLRRLGGWATSSNRCDEWSRGDPTSSNGTAVYCPLYEDLSPFGSRRPRTSSTVARVVKHTMAQYIGLSSANDEGTVEVVKTVPNTRPLR